MAEAPEAPAEVEAEKTVEAVIKARLSELLGGWYGSIETALPTVAFVVMYVVRDDVRLAVLCAVGVTFILLGVRMYIGGSVRYVLSSLAGIAIAAFFALRSGQAEDAFLPGILFSGAYGVLALVSIIGRWPIIGFLVAAADPNYAKDPTGWRKDRPLVRVCSRLTWVLVGLFVLRVALMLPLYLAGEVVWLGVAKIALGWPAYLVAILIMGVLLNTGSTPLHDVGGSSKADHEGPGPGDGTR
ncbi:MAG: DUF3159 domain-containing protein [Ornithinimicrobium sp.]